MTAVAFPKPVRASMEGRRFGRLTVKRFSGKGANGRAHWLCVCDCGAEKVVDGGGLRRGSTSSCGCYRVQICVDRHLTHGKSDTPTWRSWSAMRGRCFDRSRKDYPNYGGRGISVCARWDSFANFLADMGERPPGTSIDRFPDNDGNYEPGNCRWATPKMQSRNTRIVKLSAEVVARIRIEIKSGEAQKDIAARYAIHQVTVSKIKRGLIWANEVSA